MIGINKKHHIDNKPIATKSVIYNTIQNKFCNDLQPLTLLVS